MRRNYQMKYKNQDGKQERDGGDMDIRIIIKR
jgi:hypothetical protein